MTKFKIYDWEILWRSYQSKVQFVNIDSKQRRLSRNFDRRYMINNDYDWSRR